MSTPARRRLMRDFKRLQEDPPTGVSGAPSENNIMLWNAVIFGPVGTPFEDGTFKLLIEFSEEYPNKPPTVRFVSRMFHPNVYADGSICLDILQNRWSPTYDVSSILTSIQSLLDEPNPNSPANSQAAQLYQENKREYEKRVTAIVEQSWVDVWVSVALYSSLHHPVFIVPVLQSLIFTSSRIKKTKQKQNSTYIRSATLKKRTTNTKKDINLLANTFKEFERGKINLCFLSLIWLFFFYCMMWNKLLLTEFCNISLLFGWIYAVSVSVLQIIFPFFFFYLSAGVHTTWPFGKRLNDHRINAF